MLTIFSKPNCPHCNSAKQFLTAMDIAYTTKDITRDPLAHSFLVGEGHKTVPQFYQGDILLFEGGYATLRTQSKDQIKEMIGDIINVEKFRTADL